MRWDYESEIIMEHQKEGGDYIEKAAKNLNSKLKKVPVEYPYEFEKDYQEFEPFFVCPRCGKAIDWKAIEKKLNIK